MPSYSNKYLETAVEIRKLSLQPDIEKEILKHIKEYYGTILIQNIHRGIGNSRRKRKVFERLMKCEKNNKLYSANREMLQINIFNYNLANILVDATKINYNDEDKTVDWYRILAKIYVGLYYSDDDPEYNIYNVNMHYAIIERAFLILIKKVLKINIDNRENSGMYLYNNIIFQKLIQPFKQSHFILGWH